MDVNPMVSWKSQDHQIFLNPGFPIETKEFLLAMVREKQDLFQDQGHIFLLSSGTTATGQHGWKWVVLTQKAILIAADAVNRHLQSDDRDRWLNPLPGFHIGGLSIQARAFLSGATVRVHERWKVESFLAALTSDQITLTSLVPAQVHDLVVGRWACPGAFLRAVLVGGGSLSMALYQAARALGWPLLPTYGMTETCSQVATADLGAFTPRLRVLPHWSMEEMGEGRFALKGESLFSGWIYQDQEQVVFKNPSLEGWYEPQDRGLLLENGTFFEWLGRREDFIKIGGEGVDLVHLRQRLESLKSQLNIQADVELLAMPDVRLGHVLHLVSEASLSAEVLEQFIQLWNKQGLGFEKIRAWHVLPQLPRSVLGKFLSGECLHRVKALTCQ